MIKVSKTSLSERELVLLRQLAKWDPYRRDPVVKELIDAPLEEEEKTTAIEHYRLQNEST